MYSKDELYVLIKDHMDYGGSIDPIELTESLAEFIDNLIDQAKRSVE